MSRKNVRKIAALLLMLCVTGVLAGCEKQPQKTEVQIFIAASLRNAMTEIIEQYEKEHSDVKIICNADSSGTLRTQISEGYECDLFFSADEKQMDILEQGGFLKPETRTDVVGNRVVLISRNDSETKVTSLENLDEAKSIALAGGSVPVGSYTRKALVNQGILKKGKDISDVSEITGAQISDALGGVEISEQDNVSKVLTAVAEGACEVGTVYYSDIYAYEDKLRIIEDVNSSLTGEVRYPLSLVENREADKKQQEAAADFRKYIISAEAKKIFEKYYFDTNIE